MFLGSITPLLIVFLATPCGYFGYWHHKQMVTPHPSLLSSSSFFPPIAYCPPGGHCSGTHHGQSRGSIPASLFVGSTDFPAVLYQPSIPHLTSNRAGPPTVCGCGCVTLPCEAIWTPALISRVSRSIKGVPTFELGFQGLEAA